mgnify:CR=1 FL=1
MTTAGLLFSISVSISNSISGGRLSDIRPDVCPPFVTTFGNECSTFVITFVTPPGTQSQNGTYPRMVPPCFDTHGEGVGVSPTPMKGKMGTQNEAPSIITTCYPHERALSLVVWLIAAIRISPFDMLAFSGCCSLSFWWCPCCWFSVNPLRGKSRPPLFPCIFPLPMV